MSDHLDLWHSSTRRRRHDPLRGPLGSRVGVGLQKHEDRPAGRSHQWLPAGPQWPQRFVRRITASRLEHRSCQESRIRLLYPKEREVRRSGASPPQAGRERPARSRSAACSRRSSPRGCRARPTALSRGRPAPTPSRPGASGPSPPVRPLALRLLSHFAAGHELAVGVSPGAAGQVRPGDAPVDRVAVPEWLHRSRPGEVS